MISISLNIVFVLVNTVDSDEMPHYAAFNLALHCLQKYAVYKRLIGIPSSKYACADQERLSGEVQL